ncbi:molybdenum cofactor guanylyltransferase [Planococcus salinarum]|uniref:Probable molybdenum cofactor guanylyltransferase n=1 Tax=Planococcus salinarum TaxID=622695 RepID=A0ABX3D2N4_9BACL|nr:molybdenum cofactor guanylyltransferase [Planococcus salinarum]OHX53923.1 molybdenum cofactor guanylyltransferase [Planococcus salinarum]TAA73040.1 molybdenum cofactor guanylyltransferase [Planococcus salinarum]
MKETVGILLAGGLSRRFGSPKAFAELDGKAFYEYAYDALAAVCEHVVVITRPELKGRFPQTLDVISDSQKFAGLGPLAGIYTAMAERPARQYLVLPCDMPFIGAAETSALMQAASPGVDITAIRTDDHDIPLFSLWNGRILDRLEQELDEEQLRVMVFMAKVETEWLDSSAVGETDAFRNINKPGFLKGADEHGSDTSTGPI